MKLCIRLAHLSKPRHADDHRLGVAVHEVVSVAVRVDQVEGELVHRLLIDDDELVTRVHETSGHVIEVHITNPLNVLGPHDPEHVVSGAIEVVRAWIDPHPGKRFNVVVGHRLVEAKRVLAHA